MSDFNKFLNCEDFRIAAEKKLPRMAYDYYASGADNQITLRENQDYFSKIKLMPRSLIDVSEIDLRTNVMGVDLSFPVMVAPAAMQKMAHADGECGTWSAANEMGTSMVLSSLSTTNVESLSKHSNGNPGWFQLYVFKDRNITKNLVKRVENLGYKAIVLTVDTPFLGKREADYRNEFQLPAGLFLENFLDLPLSNVQGGLNKYVSTLLDSSLSWKDLDWLRSITKLPIIAKGIMSPKDAEIAVQHGIDAIIVSNHGARQLDTSPSTIEVLPYIVKAVNGRCPVILDGGVRSGTDVLKALALGAKAVMIGRPMLWGLTVGGKDGVKQILTIIRDGLKLAMAFTGVKTISQIDNSLIWDPSLYSRY